MPDFQQSIARHTKRQGETRSKETKQDSEGGSVMTQSLESSDKEFTASMKSGLVMFSNI